MSEPRTERGRQALEKIRDVAVQCGLSEFLDRIPGEYLDDARWPLALDTIGGRLGRCRATGCGERLWFFRRIDGRWLVIDSELTAHWPRCPGRDAKGIRKAPKRR